MEDIRAILKPVCWMSCAQPSIAGWMNAGEVFLDYTGGSLHAESQLEQHLNLLRGSVFGNPHSANPTSVAMTDHIERTRHFVLRYFNAADDYLLVFTSGDLR